MSLKLSDFTDFKDIVIQCHDNPDADALASGFALRWYLRAKGINARFVYGGDNKVTKSNLVLMINKLGILVEHVRVLDKPELLILVDCQYGETNVTKFEARNIAVIDHHQISGTVPALSDIRSSYGSCATILYELFKAEGVDINIDKNLATALYYGLYTDTNGFGELHHPADRDLRDLAAFSKSDITLFRNSNLSKEELEIAGDALKSAEYNEEKAYAIVCARPCDPNILGIISDMLLEVDSISSCLVYSILPYGVKFSVRSCVREIKASELASYLAEGFGGGGGHLIKAGGFLRKEKIEEAGTIYENDLVKAFMDKRMDDYFSSADIIYAGKNKIDIKGFKKYNKKPLEVGYVKACDLAEPDSVIFIRTLEGDVDVKVEKDLYIIIGIDGEIYPCKKQKFEASYSESDKPYVFPAEYKPAVINVLNGDRLEILPYAHSCTAIGGSCIYAKPLDRRIKVFTLWDEEKYYLGVPGDYLAVREDDLSDIYVIAGGIFERTYEDCNEI